MSNLSDMTLDQIEHEIYGLEQRLAALRAEYQRKLDILTAKRDAAFKAKAAG